MKIKITLAFSVFFILQAFQNIEAQAPDCIWAKAMGSDSSNDIGYRIAIDDSGNIYSIGAFTGISDFDPGAGIYNLNSAGNDDIYISKLDNSGNFIWAKSMGGQGKDVPSAISISVSGDLIIAGNFELNADFDPDSSSNYNLTSRGMEDVFVVKLDNAGIFQWVKQVGDAYEDNYGSLTHDSLDNLYLSGTFKSTVDFDPGLGIYNLTSFGTHQNAFISKWDSSGNFTWAKAINGTSTIAQIKLTSTYDVIVSGTFNGFADFDPDSIGIYILTSNYTDIYICKLSNAGNFIWLKSIGGPEDDYGASIAIDQLGYLYFAGYFRDTVDFDPHPLIQYNLTAPYTSHITPDPIFNPFILKLDDMGSFVWAKSIFSHTDLFAYSIALDNSQNLIIEGQFGSGSIDFDPGINVFHLPFVVPHDDFYFLKFDNSGNFLSANAIGEDFYFLLYSMVLDASDEIFITGKFLNDSMTIGNCLIQAPFSITSNSNVFIAKLNNLNTGIEEQNLETNFSIFPNPTTDYFKIILDYGINESQIAITDIFGKTIYKKSVKSAQEININTSNFVEGIYLVNVISENFNITKKIIIIR